jgi:DNA invertase Pin-like site-specific DNA recombinase
MQLGYMPVSKADGSQVLDLQRDALVAAGVQPQHLYEDLASGRRDDRPGLAAAEARGQQGAGDGTEEKGHHAHHAQRRGIA